MTNRYPAFLVWLRADQSANLNCDKDKRCITCPIAEFLNTQGFPNAFVGTEVWCNKLGGSVESLGPGLIRARQIFDRARPQPKTRGELLLLLMDVRNQ